MDLKEAVESGEILTKQDVIEARDIEYGVAKAWDGKNVVIQSLTAGDLIEWSEANEGEAKRTAGLRLIVKSAVNAEGKEIFSDKDIGMLRTKNHKITENVVKCILRLNGMRVPGEEAPKNA